jgi:ADP-ribosylglycohydrolase
MRRNLSLAAAILRFCDGWRMMMSDENATSGGEPRINQAQACLLAGAIGDALGSAVEFKSTRQIQDAFSREGITDFAPAYGRIGAITDDTQMMLFSAEGLIRALVRGYTRGMVDIPSVVHHALLRWLLTQGVEPGREGSSIRAKIDRHVGLVQEKALWSCRAPGTTCLQSLKAAHSFGEYPVNDRKGCGALMRSAPFAFWTQPFENASACAKLTHAHPTGYLSAGLFAEILAGMMEEGVQSPAQLQELLERVLARRSALPGAEECVQSIREVLTLFTQGRLASPQHIDEFGAGWLANEALAIGLWCALSATTLEQGLILAVNHGGDSDSTGMIAGNLLGIMHGVQAIPKRWLNRLELGELIAQLARDLIQVPAMCMSQGEDLDDVIMDRYPGI